ncbi:hypothetical protein [Methanimicrococcus hacksteinii]|nr:hypothetical protein [Methanimicrococcus sp. At1]
MFKRKNKNTVETSQENKEIKRNATGIDYSEKSPSMTVFSPFTGRKPLDE